MNEKRLQRLASLGFLFLFLGIVLNRLTVRIPEQTLLFASGSLAAFLIAIALLINTLVAIQPPEKKRRALIFGFLLLIISFGLYPLIMQAF
jgi:hypothetical protein